LSCCPRGEPPQGALHPSQETPSKCTVKPSLINLYETQNSYERRYTGLSAKFTLEIIDTNIDFEKQVVETDYSYTVINTALLVALLITVLYYSEKSFIGVKSQKAEI